mgnify:CR=1 FL=1
MSFETLFLQNLNLKTGIKTTTYKLICLYFKPLPQTFFLYDLLDPLHGSLTVSQRALCLLRQAVDPHITIKDTIVTKVLKLATVAALTLAALSAQAAPPVDPPAYGLIVGYRAEVDALQAVNRDRGPWKANSPCGVGGLVFFAEF